MRIGRAFIVPAIVVLGVAGSALLASAMPAVAVAAMERHRNATPYCRWEDLPAEPLADASSEKWRTVGSALSSWSRTIRFCTMALVMSLPVFCLLIALAWLSRS